MVRRLVAPNASPFTFNGTCTYIVGQGRIAIVDPGPDDDSHLSALLAAVDGERVETILSAARELLAEGGVEALSTRSLAEYSGIPVATIYRYFDNRDAIIAAYLDRELDSIESAVRSGEVAARAAATLGA